LSHKEITIFYIKVNHYRTSMPQKNSSSKEFALYIIFYENLYYLLPIKLVRLRRT